ncbi:calcineurin B homologous protein 1 [Drosophila grimshawi]|uniref:GH17638 n=1 Tax=Drosophila grimshawi TaxID=7222 RepID=B4JX45_DROGR|nr:calcineurin B homologous protein 1 [Drosophila grimshawi]EDV95321.1 GH17638 [Drosophila grimshawi]
MGQIVSRKLSETELSAHKAATGLSTKQLEQLHARFLALDRCQSGYLSPTDLLRIPQLAQNPMHRQIIDGFFTDPSNDRIDFAQFVRTCATFLVPPSGNLRANGRAQKLRLISKMFDTQRTGHSIERSDFRRVMKYMLDSVPPTDGIAICHPHPESNEMELLQLEELAFGDGIAIVDNQSISYEQFELRLDTAVVESKLAISKWL